MTILIVDDEKNIRRTLAVCLEGLGCAVGEAISPSAAIDALGRAPYDMAFVDLRLGGESGLDLLPKLLAERPGLEVVVITAYATFDTAVEAIRRGARDYLPKPFTPVQVRLFHAPLTHEVPAFSAAAQACGFQGAPSASTSPVRAVPVSGSTTCSPPREVSSDPWPVELEPSTRSHLLHLYGSLAPEVLAPALDDPSLLEPIVTGRPDLRAQDRYAREYEWARTDEDVRRRRTTVWLAGEQVSDTSSWPDSAAPLQQVSDTP